MELSDGPNRTTNRGARPGGTTTDERPAAAIPDWSAMAAPSDWNVGYSGLVSWPATGVKDSEAKVGAVAAPHPGALIADSEREDGHQ